jgi:AraC-like DNA-binding protein
MAGRTRLGAIVDRFQAAAGDVQLLDCIDAEAFLIEFGESIPTPHGRAERFVLQSLLLELAGEFGRALHARVHDVPNPRCTFVPAVLLEGFWRQRGVAPRDAYQHWVRAFFKEFHDVHPISVATSAAHMIRDAPQKDWDVGRLAAHLHTTKIALARAFSREYGTTIRHYRRLAALVMSLERVRDGKIEAVALELGYKSKKNFYQAFKSVTGVTPAAFRDLRSDQAHRIVQNAQFLMRVPRLAVRRGIRRSSHSISPPRAVAADTVRTSRRRGSTSRCHTQ